MSGTWAEAHPTREMILGSTLFPWEKRGAVQYFRIGRDKLPELFDNGVILIIEFGISIDVFTLVLVSEVELHTNLVVSL